MRRRAISLAAFAAIGVACASLPAAAYEVQPFQGNDTGGIIAWSAAARIDARQLAIEHCARYGKLMQHLASQRYYGGYISFACVWPRNEHAVVPLGHWPLQGNGAVTLGY